MFYRHLEILNTFTKQKDNFHRNTFVTVLTEIAVGHVQNKFMFCVIKTTSQLFSGPKIWDCWALLFKEFRAVSLDDDMLFRLCCSSGSDSLLSIGKYYDAIMDTWEISNLILSFNLHEDIPSVSNIIPGMREEVWILGYRVLWSNILN